VPSPPDPAVLERPWIANYPPGVPPTYDVPDVALTRFLDDAARDFPDRPALISPQGTADHITLRRRVDVVATVLAGLGIARGDRVVVALPNHQTTPVVLLALWRVGAVPVPVPPALEITRLAGILGDATPSAIVADPDTLHALVDQPGLLPAIVVLVDGREWRERRLPRLPGTRRLRRPRLHRLPDDVISLAASLEDGGDRRTLPAGPAPADVALLAYRPDADEPRGAVLTHANLVANAFQARLWVPDIQAGRERLLVADPLHDLSALTLGMLTGLLAAATVVLLDHPEPAEVAAAIEEHRPTLFPTSPARLAALVADDAAGRRDLGSLRVCVTGKEPLAREVAEELERLSGARVREGFGLLEASPLTHAQPVYGRAVPESMGLPVTDTVAIVVDPDDLSRLRAPGEPGLLLVSGPQVAAGYHNRPEETRESFVDGWLVTGDLATSTEDGVFHHVGRVDEVAERDGVIVAPRRVETVLERHPGVDRAGVGFIDGPQLIALVERRRRARVGSDELLAHCRAHLTPPSVPDRIELVDHVPLTAVGTVARSELRRRLTGRWES
jgi:long-chain acyl-CoA synthetase